MVDLSKNTNPYYPDRKMLNYLKNNIKDIKEYSDKYIEISDSRFLEMYHLKKENIIVTNGTLGAMDLILKMHQNKTIGMFNPTFWGIKEIAKINKNIIIEKTLDISLNYSSKEIDELASKSDILYLCNCNNPTLNYIETAKLIKIIRKNPKCLFIIDETVLTFDKNYNNKTAMKYVEKLKNLIVLISLSKILGICGLRTGLLVTSSSLRNKYIKIQVPYSTNIMSSLFVNRYISIFEDLTNCKNKIERNFKYLINNINKELINDVIFNSSSFVLLELKNNINYKDLVSYLLKHNIKIADINNYYQKLEKKYIRVSAGKKRQYKKLIKVLKKYNEKMN